VVGCLQVSYRVSIIAVIALDGHAWGSWRGTNTGQMWLCDFFREDLPDCRTMTYGYNSRLDTHNIDNIMDYGRGFLEEIRKVRRTNEVWLFQSS
jgi:hypothetical protein